MHILAIDDEPYALDALVHELELVFPGTEIHEEAKASVALSWAADLARQGQKLTYAFLDIHMRGINGLEMAKQLKTLHPGVLLFFCTAYSEYAFDAFRLCAKGYLLKPVSAREITRVLDEMVTDWHASACMLPRDIRIQTFGHFAVFVDGNPLNFEREKARELLAYLVDRHGAPVTTEQIAMILWENEPYDRKLKNRTTTVISTLRNALKDAGIEDILVKTWNHLALDTGKIKCDAYDFEQGDAIAINAFRGEYMVNYSWAEFTTGQYAAKIQKLNMG